MSLILLIMIIIIILKILKILNIIYNSGFHIPQEKGGAYVSASPGTLPGQSHAGGGGA